MNIIFVAIVKIVVVVVVFFNFVQNDKFMKFYVYFC